MAADKTLEYLKKHRKIIYRGIIVYVAVCTLPMFFEFLNELIYVLITSLASMPIPTGHEIITATKFILSSPKDTLHVARMLESFIVFISKIAVIFITCSRLMNDALVSCLEKIKETLAVSLENIED
jgi:hypothetical protein